MPTPGKKGMVNKRFGPSGKPVFVPANGNRYEDGSKRPAPSVGKER